MSEIDYSKKSIIETLNNYHAINSGVSLINEECEGRSLDTHDAPFVSNTIAICDIDRAIQSLPPTEKLVIILWMIDGWDEPKISYFINLKKRNEKRKRLDSVSSIANRAIWMMYRYLNKI